MLPWHLIKPDLAFCINFVLMGIRASPGNKRRITWHSLKKEETPTSSQKRWFSLGLLLILGPFIIGMAVAAIGMSFGVNTGYAINPERDF